MRFVGTAMLAFLLWATPNAAMAGGLQGRWALRVGGRTLMVLEIAPDTARPGRWTGTLRRPSHFQISGTGQQSGQIVSGVEGPIVERAVTGAPAGAAALALSIAGRAQGDEADEVLLKQDGEDHAEMAFTHIPIAPFVLVRATAEERVSESWEKDRTYGVERDWPSNSEMNAIFAADQAARQNAATIDWSVVGHEDAVRLARTKKLLESGALRSGDDFYEAAFVFQHGQEASDYLMAHSLAVAALARGRPDAGWIAAATLDRYLQRIGRKQIYGTQYGLPPGQPVTQDPYDRTLIPDALRGVLGVPPLREQEGRRRQMETERKPRRDTPEPETGTGR